MPGKHCKKRPHTPIVSKVQQGAMGAALAAKRGEATQPLRKASREMAKSMSEAELSRHLKESAGRKLAIRKISRKSYGKK